MRTLGLLSPVGATTFRYYLHALDREVRRRSQREDTAKLIALSFAQGDHLLTEEKWWTFVQNIRGYVRDLARGGADACIMGSLAWYRFADEIAENAPLPLLHPIDALLREFSRRESGPHSTLGLIAPGLASYPGPLLDRLANAVQRDVIVPEGEGVRTMEALEARAGPHGRVDVLRMMNQLRREGASLIIIGTPDVAGLLCPEDFGCDCYNLPEIHIAAAVDWMLARSSEALP